MAITRGKFPGANRVMRDTPISSGYAAPADIQGGLHGSGNVVVAGSKSAIDGRSNGFDPSKPGPLEVYIDKTKFSVDVTKLDERTVQTVMRKNPDFVEAWKELGQISNKGGTNVKTAQLATVTPISADWEGAAPAPAPAPAPAKPAADWMSAAIAKTPSLQASAPQVPAIPPPPIAHAPVPAVPPPPAAYGPTHVYHPPQLNYPAMPPAQDPTMSELLFLVRSLQEQNSRPAIKAAEAPAPEQPKRKKVPVLFKTSMGQSRAFYHGVYLGENCLAVTFDTTDENTGQFCPELPEGALVLELEIGLPKGLDGSGAPVRYNVGYFGTRYSVGDIDHVVFNIKKSDLHAEEE